MSFFHIESLPGMILILISLFTEKYFEKKRLNETSSPFIKFANNVKQAEQLTGGNPDIVDDEKYQPKKAVPAQSKYIECYVTVQGFFLNNHFPFF
jgi:hypothetical protein